MRNPLFQGAKGVQIMATPRTNRHKDMTAAPKSNPNNNATPIQSSQTEVVLASSAGRVPDSVIRPRSSHMNTSTAAPHAHPSRERNKFNIAETPSRPPSRSNLWKNYSQTPNLPPSSPTYHRGSKSPKEDFQFAVPDSVIRNPFSTATGNGNTREAEIIESTPTKPRNGSGNARSLASFAPLGMTNFSQRRDSLSVGQSISKIADTEADSSGKENLTPVKFTPLGRGMEESEDIYKTLGWDDDFDELA